MLINLDVLSYIDKMNPIQRMEYLDNNIEIRYYSEQILVALFVIDEIIQKKLKTSYFYYIKGDDSIKSFLKYTVLPSLDDSRFEKAILILDISKLIYRYTCAKKFGIKDDSINQLRLNSWGRAFLTEKSILRKNHNQYSSMVDFFEKLFDEKMNLYSELLKMLTNVSEKNIHQIEALNNQLEIAVLS